MSAKRTLPPDPENMNGQRSEWARHALETFRAGTRCEPEEALSDLLVDLRHWHDRHGEGNFLGVFNNSMKIYTEETLSP